MNYNVVTSTGGPVGGDTPATLQLTLGATPTFSPFIPGMAQSYTATTTAQVVSTAANAALSVADPSSVHTGHLVNGTYFLPAALEVGAAALRAGYEHGAGRRHRRPDDHPELERHRGRDDHAGVQAEHRRDRRAPHRRLRQDAHLHAVSTTAP